MPLPRYTLDCLSFANLIPVIDGGIDTNPKEDLSNIDQARWKAHTIGPERICMQCLGQYKPEDAALEMSGELDNPNYIYITSNYRYKYFSIHELKYFK